jgi:hypothetical protein
LDLMRLELEQAGEIEDGIMAHFYVGENVSV